MKEIAAKVDISRRTVEVHKYQMKGALRANNPAELIGFPIEHGIAGR